MKIKPRLYAGFGLVIALMGIVVGVMAILITRQINVAGDLVNTRYHEMGLVNVIRSETNFIAITMRDSIFDSDKARAQAGFAMVDAARDRRTRASMELNKTETDPEAREHLQNILRYEKEYLEAEQEARALFSENRLFAAGEVMKVKAAPTRNALLSEVDKLADDEEQEFNSALAELNRVHQLAMILLIFSFALAVLFAFGIAFGIIRGINRSVENVQGVIGRVDARNIDSLPRIQNISKDEIGDIAYTYNQLADALEHQARSEKEARRLLENQSWIKTRLAEIAMQTQGFNSYEELGSKLLTRLVRIVEAGRGAFYLAKQDSEQPKLVCIAEYAGEGLAAARKEVRIGEGIVGQCAVDKCVLLLEDVPEGDLPIGSGLGGAKPAYILALPVIFENQVSAVIEVASFKQFTDLEREFLQQAVESIAITLNRIASRMHIAKLLSDSQAHTEELQAQSEELQMQQEELRVINERLEQQYRESQTKSKELQKVQNDLEEKARQVELSSRYKSEFLANMSHELRTPLNSMLILAQILSENPLGNLSEKQVEFAKTIYSSGNDLLLLINDVLDLSKIESGKMSVTPVEIDIRSLTEAVHRKFEPIARHKNLEFLVSVDDSVPGIIQCDELRLDQILTNLLSNAFKFTDSGRVLLKIGSSPEQKQLKFTVSDTGIGIAHEQQKAIFEEFYQADGTNSRKYGGTGLGLAISRKLAALLGGNIQLDSKPGEGSTFTLFLPLDEVRCQAETPDEVRVEAAAAVAEATTATDLNVLKNKRVLIVDDDMRNIYALTTALENLNMEVLFAENGCEALEKLNNDSNIDIVLMDIMMPDMDGYEAITQIRQSSALEHLPVIALTAKAMKSDREKCLAVGASDYISKPIDMQQLSSLLKVWLYK